MNLWQIFKRPQQGNQSAKPPGRIAGLLKRMWIGKTGYLFILPMLIFYALFVLYPFFRTVILVFMRYEFLRPDRIAFVGFDNLVEWAQDPRVLETSWVSIKFFLYYVPASILVALVVALVLDRVGRASIATAYRTIFYLPVVLPASIIFIIWTWIYDPQWGVLNTLLIEVL